MSHLLRTVLLILFTAGLAGVPGPRAFAQDTAIDKIINPTEVEKMEQVLSADDMQGRGTFTPGIEKAADFIDAQFRAAGLLPMEHGHQYRQRFSMANTELHAVSAIFDRDSIPADHIAVISSGTQFDIDNAGDYEKAYIRAGQNWRAEYARYVPAKKNWLVLVDTSFAREFKRLIRTRRQLFKSPYSAIFVLTTLDPGRYHIRVDQAVTQRDLANVVAILPGRSKRSEFVVFSGHYDHLGIGKPDEKGDSIYNGANDDASGTTAVIMLARYFAARHDNERTLVFAAFTAEEIGGFGSQYFSQQLDPASVMAMFNIEMIGTESKWGTHSAYITGYERSDMGKILGKNLAGSGFTFYPDPYPDQQLFYRSDNATLARQGVPAHTISTSKMDSEKTYHTRGDEIATLDMVNMAQIIQSVAISSRSIVAGTDTPSRVDTSQLR
ncbi:MAG: M28 family peptidase [Bacteroidota bacterium]|nr:M28 family peptidase [Bacteroidota bacterium]